MAENESILGRDVAASESIELRCWPYIGVVSLERCSWGGGALVGVKQQQRASNNFGVIDFGRDSLLSS